MVKTALSNSYYEKILATGEMKCIDEEIPFEVPSSWGWCRLGTICNYLHRGKSPRYGNDKILPIMAQKCNQWDRIYTDRCLFSDKAFIEKYKEEQYLQVGDVIVNSTGGGTVGRTGYIEKYVFEKYTKFVADSHVTVVRTNKLVSSRYIYYYLISPFIQIGLEERCSGSTNQIELGTASIYNNIIPLPPYAEQKRIIEKIAEVIPVVNRFGEKQDFLEKLNQGLKPSLHKSILQEAIQGRLVPQDPNDEPASALLDKIQAEKVRLVKKGILKKKDLQTSIIYKGENNKYYEQVGSEIMDVSDEIPFDLPCSWQWVRFGQIVRMSIGKTPARGDARYWSNAIEPWVSISDMVDYGHINNTKEKISNAAASLMGSISPVGSLLMSFKLTVGRTSILNIEAYHNEAIITICPFIDDEFALRDYLFYTLPILSNMGDSKDAIKGKTLNSKSLNNLLIPLPPLKEQRHIINSLEELYARL